MLPDDPRHGTSRGYYAHRRQGQTPCKACAHAQYLYSTRYYVDRMNGRSRTVAAAPIIEHVEWLNTQGMTTSAVIEAAGIGRSNVYAAIKGYRKSFRVDTARKLLAVNPHTRPVNGENVRIGSEPTLRRIRALLATGWTHAHMLEMSGVRTAVVLNRTPGNHIETRIAQSIADMYDRIHMTPGPSEVTRRRAAKLGYMPPLAWDNIDVDDIPANSIHKVKFDQMDIDPVVVERLLRGERIAANKAEQEETVLRIMNDPERTLAEFAALSHLPVHSIAERIHKRARRAA